MKNSERVLTFGLSGDKLGGINTFLLNMDKHMGEDCTFDYVIEGPNSISQKQIEENGSKVFHTCYFKEGPIKRNIQIYHILKEGRNTYKIAFFNLFSMVHIIPIILSKLCGYKIVLFAHNNNIEAKSKLYRSLHVINRWIMKFIPALRLTNSFSSAKFMYGQEKAKEAEQIFCAIDYEYFKFSAENRKQYREELGLNGKKVIGFCGRLQEQKNPLRVIDIFNKAHQIDADCKLIVIGDGYLLNDMKKLVNQYHLDSDVQFLGFRSDVEKLYQAMDVFLLPSLFEGLGIVLVEAQAAGLPCVASSESIPHEVNITNHVSFLSLNESSECWAKEILRLSREKYDRKEFGKDIEGSRFNIATESVLLKSKIKSVVK